MANGNVTNDGKANMGKIKEDAQKDFEQQLALYDLQRKVNAQNTLVTALTTLEKGKDDVLRAIANNLK